MSERVRDGGRVGRAAIRRGEAHRECRALLYSTPVGLTPLRGPRPTLQPLLVLPFNGYAMETAVNLLRGITGFRHVDEPPLSAVDLRAFRTSCHAAARALGGRVVSAEMEVGSAAGANYIRATLDLPGGLVSLVLNLNHPIVAFVGPLQHDGDELQFVDVPALTEVFRSFGTYAILSASEAREPVTDEASRLLSPAELRQIRYWRPRCIGEVVFNRWD